MFRLLTTALLSLCLLASPALAEDDGPDIPDLSEFDRDTLQTVAEQLYVQIANLQEELAELREELAAAQAGEDGDGGDDASWRVTILANQPTDVSELRRQLENEREKLASDSTLATRLREAERRVADMQAARENYIDNQGRRRTRAKYSARDMRDPQAQVRTLQREQRAVQVQIRTLERDIEQAGSIRRISAQLEDGRGVTIIARGAFLDLGTSLQVGQDYMITGRAALSGSSPNIQLLSAALAGDEVATTVAP
ncbi:hypothetical protein ACERK3_09360 [Phycisphaerales bacterium AB-hyl4]|uniref:Uncharacterized protein n=1 Tax=Natronomicrosphaera hydrolytica TaxID=3242702 RepID=A0ABV4U4H0_9BACT